MKHRTILSIADFHLNFIVMQQLPDGLNLTVFAQPVRLLRIQQAVARHYSTKLHSSLRSFEASLVSGPKIRVSSENKNKRSMDRFIITQNLFYFPK